MNAPDPAPRALAERRTVTLAALVSVVPFALRWQLASQVGFGDAEALYVAYGLHPQPAYLDHPGLVGVIARVLGSGASPSPEVVHRFTAIAATLVPWVGAAAARAAGAAWPRALVTCVALALLPELAVGLFGLTPDLPLAALWLASLGLSALSLRSPVGGRRALLGALGAGFTAGLAVAAKASGALLLPALALAWARPAGRAHLRTAAPWCALGVAAVLASPVVLWEARHGFPMLHHRLVATQGAAGLSLRNVGALVGGQLLYVTPPFLVGAYHVLRALVRRRGDPVAELLVAATVVPGLPLVALCLWSRVAEPHWLGPAYLGLAIGVALVPELRPRVARTAVATGALAVGLGWLLVSTPLLPRLAGAGYRPRYDLVNDLYAWRVATPLLDEELDRVRSEGGSVAIVGPHWTVCAQAHVAVGATVQFGCRTPTGDDFATWYPDADHAAVRTLLYVTDDRFDEDPAKAFPRRDVVTVRSARVFRGGRTVRTIRVLRLERAGIARTGAAADPLTLPRSRPGP